jgi:hypothetical protein
MGVNVLKAKNIAGEIIEVTENTLRINLTQIELFLDTASKFEELGDIASRDMYLECAIRMQHILDALFPR